MPSVYLLAEGVHHTYAFEHMMAHRTYWGAMSPLSRFSVVPYVLDPMMGTDIPGGPWHMNHQQAHNDAQGALPAQFATPSVMSLDLFVGQNLRDTRFDNPDSRRWWTFANHMEHYVTNDTILPAPTVRKEFENPYRGGAGIDWIFPFW